MATDNKPAAANAAPIDEQLASARAAGAADAQATAAKQSAEAGAMAQKAERDRVYSEFNDRENDIILANVQRVDQNGNVIMEIGRAEAVMPPNHQVRSERYRPGNRMRVLLMETASYSMTQCRSIRSQCAVPMCR